MKSYYYMYIVIQELKLKSYLYIVFCLNNYKVGKVKHELVVKQPLTSTYGHYRENRYHAKRIKYLISIRYSFSYLFFFLFIFSRVFLLHFAFIFTPFNFLTEHVMMIMTLLSQNIVTLDTFIFETLFAQHLALL